MTNFWNYAGSTTLIVFFVFAQVYPKQTAIVVFLTLGLLLASPFIPR